jgi:ABC-type Zn uptake system ZnuABC Zn-binding protein ZnuA
MLSLFWLAGCATKPTEVWPEKPGPKVLTTFAPIQSFALNVVGDQGTVISLLSTKGPHDHGEPTAEQNKLASKADVLFANGLGLETMNAKLIASTGRKDFNLCELGPKLPKECLLEGVCHHNHAPGEPHEHGDDPHVWLSPKHARTMVEAIRDEMKRIDPANAEAYAKRAADYLETLRKLEQDGIAMLKDKTERRIVTFHDSLAYFGECFDIKIVDFIQPEPGVDPDGKQLKRIIEHCKEKGIRLIVVEPQYNRNTAAATILKELRDAGLDARFVEIDPLETANPAEMTADFYERKMRRNLENLAQALR